MLHVDQPWLHIVESRKVLLFGQQGLDLGSGGINLYSCYVCICQNFVPDAKTSAGHTLVTHRERILQDMRGEQHLVFFRFCSSVSTEKMGREISAGILLMRINPETSIKKKSKELQNAALRISHRLSMCRIVFTKLCHYYYCHYCHNHYSHCMGAN